ncbi:hypothetical protein FS749_010168 [Ceratobasidium sp. UAMH 11750]|nr:hypothetical protein FS749_010168 [Ceratobasidium sp. UAMH 11750]
MPIFNSTFPHPCSPASSRQTTHHLFHNTIISAPRTHLTSLDKICREVEDMLRASLTRFVSGACGSSGYARGLFGTALGVITMAIGLVSVLLGVLAGRPCAARIAALPIFWLGAWVAIMSLHGVCVVIFLFGVAVSSILMSPPPPRLHPPLQTRQWSRRV